MEFLGPLIGPVGFQLVDRMFESKQSCLVSTKFLLTMWFKRADLLFGLFCMLLEALNGIRSVILESLEPGYFLSLT